MYRRRFVSQHSNRTTFFKQYGSGVDPSDGSVFVTTPNRQPCVNSQSSIPSRQMSVYVSDSDDQGSITSTRVYTLAHPIAD
jgi:hypothetical protein